MVLLNLLKVKKDGIIVDKNIIPSNKQIIKLERDERLSKHHIACAINETIDTAEKEKNARKYKSINDIHNLKIYGTVLLSNYSDILITSKDGIFNAMWFRLDFVETNKFKLTTSPISIIEPTIDDVIDYCSNNIITEIEDIDEAESKISEAIRKIPDLKDGVKVKIK